MGTYVRDAQPRAPVPAMWERARGWVLSQGVAIYAYCTTENNPILHREAGSRLDLVLSERE